MRNAALQSTITAGASAGMLSARHAPAVIKSAEPCHASPGTQPPDAPGFVASQSETPPMRNNNLSRQERSLKSQDTLPPGWGRQSALWKPVYHQLSLSLMGNPVFWASSPINRHNASTLVASLRRITSNSADGWGQLFEVPNMPHIRMFSAPETHIKLAASVSRQDGNTYERPVTGRVRLSRAEPSWQGDPHV
jgi:hypothetical protein